ncbi:MAG: membrane protein insertion efficiency factor YidD [Spirochaetaceae bacterium]|nr:membrane protein insertion efficiency factor YidD [Spirochaetaceae bacterium]
MGTFSLIARNAVLCMIRGYQLLVSPHLPRCCRYTPTCSAYTYQTVQKYGIVRGLWLGFTRILRCHPFHPGGYDPAP